MPEGGGASTHSFRDTREINDLPVLVLGGVRHPPVLGVVPLDGASGGRPVEGVVCGPLERAASPGHVRSTSTAASGITSSNI